MTFTKSEHPVRPMSVEAASDYARRLVEYERRGAGDTAGAMTRLEQRYGIGFWQLNHLRAGRAKSCEASLLARLRSAYLDLCEWLVLKLQHQIAIEKAGGDDTLEHLEEEARALAAKIAARKAALSPGRVD